MTKRIMESVKGDTVLKAWIDRLIELNGERVTGMDNAAAALDNALKRHEFLERLRLEIEVGP